MEHRRTDEFRKDAVRMASTSGLTRKQLSDDLIVGASCSRPQSFLFNHPVFAGDRVFQDNRQSPHSPQIEQTTGSRKPTYLLVPIRQVRRGVLDYDDRKILPLLTHGQWSGSRRIRWRTMLVSPSRAAGRKTAV